eukprot:scaffold250916_cov33-Tisochrysis_lutea.AAC.3
MHAAAQHVAPDAGQKIAPMLAPQLGPERRIENTTLRRAHRLWPEGDMHAVEEPSGRRLGEARDEDGWQDRLGLIGPAKIKLEARAGNCAIWRP